MAAKHLLDLWIVELNRTYKDVPIATLTDWLQQGRLLAEDLVRPASSAHWQRVDEVPVLRTFLPRSEPQCVEDEAEALAQFSADIPWRRQRAAEDDEVDMIPLIDVSLVLLIFFMMTAAVAADACSPIATPEAAHHLQGLGKEMYWLGIDVTRSPAGGVLKGEDGWPTPRYSLGKETRTLVEPATTLEPVLAYLRSQLASAPAGVRIGVRAEHTLSGRAIDDAMLQLQRLEARLNSKRAARLSIKVFSEVSEARPR